MAHSRVVSDAFGPGDQCPEAHSILAYRSVVLVLYTLYYDTDYSTIRYNDECFVG
jgi:hypothetical protein